LSPVAALFAGRLAVRSETAGDQRKPPRGADWIGGIARAIDQAVAQAVEQEFGGKAQAVGQKQDAVGVGERTGEPRDPLGGGDFLVAGFDHLDRRQVIWIVEPEELDAPPAGHLRVGELGDRLAADAQAVRPGRRQGGDCRGELVAGRQEGKGQVGVAPRLGAGGAQVSRRTVPRGEMNCLAPHAPPGAGRASRLAPARLAPLRLRPTARPQFPPCCATRSGERSDCTPTQGLSRC
jgi:hypothetical protein